jgi:hypothetical protein
MFANIVAGAEPPEFVLRIFVRTVFKSARKLGAVWFAML